MSSSEEKKPLTEISTRMRSEWDRRVAHDYRYWMSDGVENDQQMWEAGERDFQILFRGLGEEELSRQIALEIGCGVGRLLRPASRHFSRVIGVDVSEKAIEKGKELLSDLSNVELVLGNGVDLSAISDASVDIAFTFAALSSMPVSVLANYLAELSRVVKPGGRLRLQLYLGEQQRTSEEDTLAIRCFSEEHFVSAAEQAGFPLDFIEELSLPFEVSNSEEGLVAKIAGLHRSSQRSGLSAEIQKALIPEGEQFSGDNWQGSRTEYLMALARAKQHMEAGRTKEAEQALRFAVENYQEPDADVLEMLQALEGFSSNQEGKPQNAPAIGSSSEPACRQALGGVAALGSSFNAELYQRNMRVLAERFPPLLKIMDSVQVSDEVSVLETSSGSLVLKCKKMPLSHREKPQRAGEAWAERTLNTPGVKEKEALIVAGFADAYHLRALLRATGKAVHVIEPRPEIIKAALGIFDCSDILQRIASLSVSEEAFKEALSDLNTTNTEFVVHPQTQAISGDQVAAMRILFRGACGFGQLQPSIAVVGPIWGGSHPIAGYCARALGSLNQRVINYDLGGFNESFCHLGEFLKSSARQGVVENLYVEMLSQLVLEGVNERPVDIVICLAQAPLSPRVLTELRARGIITVMWFVEDCRRFTTWQQIARFYDYVFLIQKDEFPRLVEQAGAGRAIYLPVGCDPEIHQPLQLSEEEKLRFGSELSFVGAGYNNRRHVFSLLGHRDFKIWGTEWPACLPFTRIVQNAGARVKVEDYVKVFNAATININLHSSSERDGVEPQGDFVNPRTFELASTGAFQLVDQRRLLSENFVPGKEVATFSDEKELLDKADYYLAHPEERAVIIEAARKRALSEHTYQHRMKTMLDCIYADRYEQLSMRVKRGPWQMTFKVAEPHAELSKRLRAVYERGDEPQLDSLVADIKTGQGTLTETEQIILFLHHIRGQISYVSKLRKDGQ